MWNLKKKGKSNWCNFFSRHFIYIFYVDLNWSPITNVDPLCVSVLTWLTAPTTEVDPCRTTLRCCGMGSRGGKLLGRPLTLITDHAPLQSMVKAKDTNYRVTRWILSLQVPTTLLVPRRNQRRAQWAEFGSKPHTSPHPLGEEEKGKCWSGELCLLSAYYWSALGFLLFLQSKQTQRSHC